MIRSIDYSIFLILFSLIPIATRAQDIVCNGRVEAVDGEVTICPEVNGQIQSLLVHEGDRVTTGQLLAVIFQKRQEANFKVAEAQCQLAEAKLKRVIAGTGAEEIQAAQWHVKALESQIEQGQRELSRRRPLLPAGGISPSELEDQELKVKSEQGEKQAREWQWKGLRRGALNEEKLVARQELVLAQCDREQAQTELMLCKVFAPMAGTILQLHGHVGDSVSTVYHAPLLTMADTARLQVRVELQEGDIYAVRPGEKGRIFVLGVADQIGEVKITTLLPSFCAKRLFEADTSLRVDTRVVQVLCGLAGSFRLPIYNGQRVTVRFPTTIEDKAIVEK